MHVEKKGKGLETEGVILSSGRGEVENEGNTQTKGW